MRDQIDALIADRAGWFFGAGPVRGAARAALRHVLHYEATVRLAEAFEPLPPQEIFQALARMLAQQVTVEGLERIPRRGPALVVANHPTGIADGVMLYHALARVRPDLFFFANSDILRVLPQLDQMVAPVEWRLERRSHAKTRATMSFTRTAIDDERLGVIFPSGRLAKRQGLRLAERPWMPSAAMIARRYGLPVVPLHITARNSALFYLFDLIHPTLRDITLFHETLNKARQPYRISVGRPIPPQAQAIRSEEAILQFRDACLALARPTPGATAERARIRAGQAETLRHSHR